MGPSRSSRRRQASPTDRQERKDSRSDKRKPRDGGKKKTDGGTKPTATRAGGDTERVKSSPPPTPVCADPFKKYTREQRRAHYETMKEERVAGTSGAARPTQDKIVRTGALTEPAQQTPPPLPNKTNPTLKEMSHERDMGPSAPGRAHSLPLSTAELQQGKTFTPSKRIDGVVKQCCIQCNSHANKTCQGAKTHIWHGPAAVFPGASLHPSVTALMIPFGERLGTPAFLFSF